MCYNLDKTDVGEFLEWALPNELQMKPIGHSKVDEIATGVQMVTPKDIKIALAKVSEDVTNLGFQIKNVVKYLAIGIAVAISVAVLALLRV